MLRASPLHLSRLEGMEQRERVENGRGKLKRKTWIQSEGEAERAEWAGFKEEAELREKSIQGSS